MYALASNISRGNNTASGTSALYDNNGSNNTAAGVFGLSNNQTGNANTAVGWLSLASNVSGNYNTAIGAEADVRAGNYTNGAALGYQAQLTASNSIVLGNGSITAIYAHVPTISGISDRRRKKDIRVLDADLGLDFIEKLEPVSYRFNNGDETERYGFIAQDLEQALPARLHHTIERSEPEHGLALIERQNDNDRTYRVSYGELTAPIVKSIQQQQQEITELRQQNAELRHALANQAAAFKAETDALHHSIELKEQATAAR
jgi:trimeric autotransporter adhesin